MERNGPETPKARWAGKLCLTTLSILLCLVILEFTCRFIFFGSDALSFKKMHSWRPLGESGMIQASDHREIIFELKPNLDEWFKGARFSTNSHGLRDREFPEKKPGGTYRVAVIGDSFTMGSGVEVEEIWHELLEARLSRASPDREIEFLNFGCGGYGLRQYLAVIAHKVLRFDVDLILLCLSQNDDEILPDSRFEDRYIEKSPTSGFFRLWSPMWFHQNRIYHAMQRPGNDGELPPWLEEVKHNRAGHMDYYFSQLENLTKQTGIPVVALYLSMAEGKSDYIRTQVERHGIPFGDLSLPFSDLDLADYVIATVDYHPNGAANAIFADEAAGFLSQLGIPPEPNLQ